MDKNIKEKEKEDSGQFFIKAFLKKIFKRIEKEKKRIASYLHDEVSTMAVVLSSDLALLSDDIRENHIEEALKTVETARKTAAKMVKDYNKIASELSPIDIDLIGIVDVFNVLFSTIKWARINFTHDIDERDISEEQSVAILRVTEEAMENVHRHSGSKIVDVRLQSSDRKIVLHIYDHGKGFDVKKCMSDIRDSETKLGILNMRTRIEAIDGVFLIKSESDKGTKIRVELPVETK